MPYRTRFCAWSGHGLATVLTSILILVGRASSGSAQPPVPDPSLPAGANLPSYRPPALALVQPPAGGSVPQDRPIIVFRFAAGEAGDPIDARTFAVTVGNENRTALFQVAASEAWGPLAASPGGQRPSLALGAHRIAARICSIRGACAELGTTVTVVAPIAPASDKAAVERKRTLIDLLLLAARKLITP